MPVVSVVVNAGIMSRKVLCDLDKNARLEEVRKQSKEIAQKLRARVQIEKENQLRKIGKIKEKELQEWKQRQACELQRYYEICEKDYGSAHQAAEEERSNLLGFQEERETFDLIAADRGRSAIAKELEKRKKDEEAKALRRKKLKQKTIGIQTERIEKVHRAGKKIQPPVASTSTQASLRLEDCSDQDSDNEVYNKCYESDEEPEVARNIVKPSTVTTKVIYNPQNFTTHSTDSSVNTPDDSSLEFHQITNILKRQQCWDFDNSPEKPQKAQKPPQKSPEIVQIDLSSESEEEAQPIRSPLKLKRSSPIKKKTIALKQPPRIIQKRNITRKPEVAPREKSVENNRRKNVKYVDFSNQYSKEYQQPKDFVIQHRRPSVPSEKLNAMEEARSLNREEVNKEVNQDLLSQLTAIRSREALEKEHTRRDYERMRERLETLSKEQNQVKASGKTVPNYSENHLSKLNRERKEKMNQAVDNVLKNRVIITCPPVNPIPELPESRRDSSDLNVAEIAQKPTTLSTQSHKHKDELTHIVKVERLKDLLERINFQKQLLMREIEKSENIPGPDLEKVLKCIEQLEKEKNSLSGEIPKKVTKEQEDLVAQQNQAIKEREIKVLEREKRLADNIKELYRNYKDHQITEEEQKKQREVQKVDKSTEVRPKRPENPRIVDLTSNSEPSLSSVDDSVAPIEILIKVQQPKSHRNKKSKKIKVRCIDTLSKEPGKVYPKTPLKKSRRDLRDEEFNADNMVDLIADKLLEQQKLFSEPSKIVEPPVTKVPPKVSKPVEKSTKNPTKVTKSSSSAAQTTSVRNVTKPPQVVQTKEPQKQTESRPSRPPPVIIRDDVSSVATISTSYNSLPNQLQPSENTLRLNAQDQNRQLNPTLMHYVTRLLGMSQNIGNKLGVSVSSVSTPGSSVIQNSANISESQELSFDNDRMEKLKKFIGDNYNFLNEINESLERSKMSGTVEDNVDKVENIWRNVLKKKGKRQESPPKLPRSRPETAKSPAKVVKSQRSEVIKPPTKPARSRPETARPPPPRIVRPQSSTTQQVPKKTILKSPPTQQVPIPQPAPQVQNNDLLNMTKYLESHMLNNYVEYTSNCQKRISDLTQMMDQVRQEKLKLIENSLSSSEMQNFTEYKDIQTPARALIEQATSSGSELKSPSHRDDPPSEEINNIMMRKQIGVSKDSGIHSMSRPVTASDYRESPEVRETTFEPILKDLQKQTLPLPSTLTTSQPSSLSSQKKRPPTTTIRFSPQMEEKLTPAHELSTIVEVETPVASKINILEDERVDLTKESIQYENFPDYEDYLKKVERQTAGDLQKLFEVSQLKYKEFVQPAVYGIEDSLAKTKEDDEGNSSDSSIDIVAELKKRNIITRSFENLSSSGDESDGPATKEPKDQLDSLLNSPKKPARQNPEIRILESSRILPSPPTSPEKKQQKPAVQKSPRKNKEAPKSDSPRLEDDLTDMGMPWMTSMLKRNQESNTIQSSSSSASVSIGNNQEKQEQNPNRPGKLISRKTYEIEVRDPNSSSPTTNSSTDTTSSGKPLNLRDFLRRELTIRSENKNLTNESSLSSKFMQSLLNATGTSSSNSGMQSQDVKLRTSTPVQLDSTRLGASLFSADSRMSSVRMSSSGEDKKSPS